MFGKLTGINGHDLTIHLDEPADLYRIQKFANGKQPVVELGIKDGRNITPLQRRKIYSMFHDISLWSGYTNDDAKQVMKYEFIIKTGYPEFSLSDVEESVATKFIEFLIMFCLKWDIPFATRTMDMIQDSYWYQLQCLLTRHCCICNKPHSDIDHLIGTVGMGRNRQHIDNENSYFCSECRFHHTERHKLGWKSFMLKYHIKPIRLTKEQIKRLHIGGTENG